MIAVFSIFCILINIYQMQYLDTSKQLANTSKYVNSSKLDPLSQEEVKMSLDDNDFMAKDDA